MSISTEQLLQQARRFQEAGDRHRAEACFRAVLELDARHIEALAMLAVLLAQRGLGQEGLETIERAIKLKSSIGRLHYYRGAILEQAKRYAEAVASYDKSIAREPEFFLAYNGRGLMLAAQGKYEEALRSYERVITLNPTFADVYFNQGTALNHLGRDAEALACFDRAIALNPSMPFFYNNRGATLKALGRKAEALEMFEKAVALMPDYAHAHNNLGSMLHDQGRWQEALTHFDKAIALLPDYAPPYCNRGATLGVLHRFDEAIEDYDNALRLNPGYVEAYNNKGFTLQEMKRYGEALEYFNRAIALSPRYAAAHFNKSQLLLVQGQFAEGWRLAEWRWQRPDAVLPQFEAPLWQGEPLAGKTILLYGEQGMGDTIQFCRYVPLLQALGARVVLQVPAPLRTLLGSMVDAPECIALEEARPPHDYYSMLLSLPMLFHTDLHTIPADIPYLFPQEGKKKEWSERLGARQKPRIGLVWAGNPAHKNNHNRSMMQDDIAPLMAVQESYQFYALQKDTTSEERGVLARWGVEHLGDKLADFTDTAAVMDLMDIVITVDTSVAHLAGAMGRPVWVLLPFAPDFRWLAEGVSSPWYPTVRLFRQSEKRSWPEVMQHVAHALAGGG